jgi:hypothetical protein
MWSSRAFRIQTGSPSPSSMVQLEYVASLAAARWSSMNSISLALPPAPVRAKR